MVPRDDLAIAGDIHGVLGQDVLAGLRYTIDYRNRRIVWHDREPEVSPSIAVLPMAFRNGLPFVDLPQIDHAWRSRLAPELFPDRRRRRLRFGSRRRARDLCARPWRHWRGHTAHVGWRTERAAGLVA